MKLYPEHILKIIVSFFFHFTLKHALVIFILLLINRGRKKKLWNIKYRSKEVKPLLLLSCELCNYSLTPRIL